MDWLTFASKLIWPIVVLLLLWPSRKAIARKILTLRRGKVTRDSIEGEFDEIVDDVQEDMEKAGLLTVSPTPTPTPTPSQYDDELKEQLKETIVNLSRFEKLILILYYYDAKTWGEISNELGIPKDVLVKKHQDILKNLRSMINPSE